MIPSPVRHSTLGPSTLTSQELTVNVHGTHRDWTSGKTWKNGKAFSSQGILLRLEKSGNFTQNTGKILKSYTGKLNRILEKSGKFVS